MSDQSISRRHVLMHHAPALAAMGSLLGTGLAFAQQPPADNVPRGGAAAPGAGGGAMAAGGGGKVMQSLAASYQGDKYALPPLPYPAEALEPHIDAKTMQLHHGTHHKGYVDGLNKAAAALAELSKGDGDIDAARLSGLQRDLSFNAGGHALHAIFWATMGKPADGGGANAPSGPLADALSAEYGSFDQFKRYFTAVATSVKGSGWAVLALEPLAGRLMTFAVNEHDAHLLHGSIPLLPVDVWEHAYYLKHGPKRAAYVGDWFNVVDWNAVGEWYGVNRAAHRG